MPHLYIIAGCNGAGKTTGSNKILPACWNCQTYVNADDIAARLWPSNPAAAALEAGRMMLSKLDELMNDGVDFAFETTLATRSYAGLINKAKSKGYKITLFYLWLVSPEMAMARVAARVKKGGHSIPDEVIERRYYRGISNFMKLYRALCNTWVLMDSRKPEIAQIAEGRFEQDIDVRDLTLWNQFVEHGERVSEPVQLYGTGITDRLIAAMMQANHEMLLEAAANNELLVVGDGADGFKHAPAAELLKEFEASALFKSLCTASDS